MQGGSHTYSLQRDQKQKQDAHTSVEYTDKRYNQFYDTSFKGVLLIWRKADHKLSVCCKTKIIYASFLVIHRRWQRIWATEYDWSPRLWSRGREPACRLRSGSKAWGGNGNTPWLGLGAVKPVGIHEKRRNTQLQYATDWNFTQQLFSWFIH